MPRRDIHRRRSRRAPPKRTSRAAFACWLCCAAGTKVGIGLIAEIKKASPSKGMIRADFDPPALAAALMKPAAPPACRCSRTARPFRARRNFSSRRARRRSFPSCARTSCWSPIRWPRHAPGADAILVIMAMVDDTVAAALLHASRDHGMDTLCEVHNEAELDRALALGAEIIGINNRDLNTFVTDIAVTLKAGSPASRRTSGRRRKRPRRARGSGEDWPRWARQPV